MNVVDAQAASAIRSTRCVLPDGLRAGVIVLRDQRIDDVLAHDATLTGVDIDDVGDAVVAPGIVDAHVHINEPGRTEWEGFETATQAAAAGGTTTLVDMPLNSCPVTTDVDALRQKRAAAGGNCHVDVGFYGGLVPGNATQIGPLLAGGALGIKAFLCDSGLDDFPAVGKADLQAAMPVIAKHGSRLLVHCELVTGAPPPLHDARSYAEFCASRPAQWELDAIELMISLCEKYTCPVHIVHLSTSRALPLLAEAKRKGLPLTVETCPHYLYFAQEQLADGDTRVKCAPPIRDTTNRDALWDALRSGVIDTIGSDHSPCPPEMKILDRGDFATAWGGISSLQWTLPITWTAARQRGIAVEQLSEWLSAAPARMLGLEARKGRIAKGCDADLVIWDPDQEFEVKREQILHRHKVTPYEGARLAGAVQRTYVRGKRAYHDGSVASEYFGSLLTTSGSDNYRNRT